MTTNVGTLLEAKGDMDGAGPLYRREAAVPRTYYELEAVSRMQGAEQDNAKKAVVGTQQISARRGTAGPMWAGWLEL